MSSKKSKSPPNNDAQKMKQLRQSYRKEAEQYKQKVKPLIKFLKNKKLKFQNANVGNERVQYFRIDQFQKIVDQNKEYIDGQPALNQLIKKFYKDFIFFKRPNNIKIKYPKVLQPVSSESPDKKYASFRFDTTQSKHSVTIFIIICVLALVMFPIWPFEVKYVIWYISLIILVILVGIIVVRLVIYLIIVIFNYHVWIFPNLLNSNGFLDSFIPVIEVSKGDKSWFGVFLRLFAISSLMLFVLHVYMNPTFFDQNVLLTKETISDIHDWGVGKLKNQGNFSQRAITNLQQILNKTADVQNSYDQSKVQTDVSSSQQQQMVIKGQDIEQQSVNYDSYVDDPLKQSQGQQQQQQNNGQNEPKEQKKVQQL